MGIGVKVAQACLVAFNFIFVLIGLAGIIAGAVIKIKYNDYANLTSEDVGGASILLIAVGGFIFVIAFLGCCGALKRSTVMLTIYVVLLVLVLIAEIAGAITAYVFKGKLKTYVRDGMHNALKHFNETKYKDAMDDVQKEFKCCGVDHGYRDYLNLSLAVPKSCCRDKSWCNANMTSTTNGTMYYEKSCVDELFNYLNKHLAIIGGMAIGVAVIQILGVIFACVVRNDVKEGYGYV